MAILEKRNEQVILTVAGHDFTAKKPSAVDLYKVGIEQENGVITPIEAAIKMFYLAIKDNYPDEKYESMVDFFTLDLIKELSEELKKIGLGEDKKKDVTDTEVTSTIESTTSI